MECAIRQWEMSDKVRLAALLNNKKIQDNLRDGIPYPYTEADAEEYIAATLAADKYSSFSFAITLDNVVIGSISAFRNENVHYRTAELGYYVDEFYWSNGYASEAVRLICKYIFDNTDIIRIYSETFANNIASCRVLEKNGFRFEGILHCNAEKNGKIMDTRLYGKIKNGDAA